MKTKLLSLILLVFSLISGPSWGQIERKIVVEPELPGSNDLITISVTNSKCYTGLQIVPDPQRNSFQIVLSYLVAFEEECLENNADAFDFKTTVGPLEPGEYHVSLFVGYGARGGALTDQKNFTVIDAPPRAINLSEGGITGFYFNPAADGSYISVLETNYNTLVIWNTFDADGNQLWVYGVGALQDGGSTVVAETYINRSSGFLPNGEVDAEAEPWGVLRIDLASCREGTFTFDSDLPEFDSGQFPIVRLAYSKQIGCVDSE